MSLERDEARAAALASFMQAKSSATHAINRLAADKISLTAVRAVVTADNVNFDQDDIDHVNVTLAALQTRITNEL